MVIRKTKNFLWGQFFLELSPFSVRLFDTFGKKKTKPYFPYKKNFFSLFKLDKDGMLSSRQTLQLAPATTYELIVMAEDSQKHRTVVTVLLRTRPTGQLALSTILSIGIFFLLASIFAIMVMLVVRRVSSM